MSSTPAEEKRNTDVFPTTIYFGQDKNFRFQFRD